MVESEKMRSLATRILSAMESFHAGATPPAAIGDAIGVYDAGEGAGPLWITPVGVVRDGASTVLRFDAMTEVHAPGSKSRAEVESSHVRVVMADGTVEIIVVAGGSGRFCDSFEFARFLSRAVRLSRP